ncbi:hypothetical protein K5X82_14320 [Halosquirtibacter xylanolyticus]|uniref:hypothetical protein n=1 Tax=Halosquirtibacter xylanolyticus TaxID=3374599 RepID=UPI0037487AF3|nr:hypothetical protein K5X82_14320 [Prolixibacteraceae bacterium]
MKKIILCAAFILSVAGIANAVTITTSCGHTENVPNSNFKSTGEMVQYALALEAEYCD